MSDVTPLKIFNNMTRQKEDFIPSTPGMVKFYSCGPTTYNFLHVGNGMALVVGDMFHRVLRALGHQVIFVRNFTDVDDKIINIANELKVDPLAHAARFVDECLKDMNSLGMLPATHTPKVSDHIPEIIAMIETLIAKGFAYNVDGEVLFHVPEFKEYGKLSKKDLESLEHGIRVEVDSHKRHPSDFVLWKPAKPGEPFWASPWGNGRPGWHIECSAMAKKYLGETIDLHHGGVDLIFPHHENEIAQSECCNGHTFSRYWAHNEFLNFGNEKMSKSLGNVVTIRDFVEKFSGEVLRQILLSSHYRSRIEWGNEAIERAFNEVERLHKFVVQFEHASKHNADPNALPESLAEIKAVIPEMKKELANDFNISGAMSHLYSLIRLVNRQYLDESGNYQQKLKLHPDVINAIAAVIDFARLATGLIKPDAAAVLERLNLARKNLAQSGAGISEAEILQCIADRKNARATKQWAEADRIRNLLLDKGIVLKDNPDGTCTWSYR